MSSSTAILCYIDLVEVTYTHCVLVCACVPEQVLMLAVEPDQDVLAFTWCLIRCLQCKCNCQHLGVCVNVHNL